MMLMDLVKNYLGGIWLLALLLLCLVSVEYDSERHWPLCNAQVSRKGTLTEELSLGPGYFLVAC
jgi:hypothetical protein